MRFSALGFRAAVQGLGSRIEGLEFTVRGFRNRILRKANGLRLGLGIRAWVWVTVEMRVWV